ncbi:protein-disulfide reductase DsbD domain-containing protein [Desertibaculum subflavum]|uniref:protein-disulfide reductase DsbD domain-containing protein n=1 Tax=Desertibaculum subflavum TaxID=2268458 RepID=UPI000E670F81
MRASTYLIAAVGAAAWLAGGAGPAVAGDAADWQQRPHVALRLSAAALGRGGERVPWAAVELRLDPGWKIYWRSPGEAGVPTTIDWSGSANLRAAETRWPRPKRARIWNVDTVGYGGEVTFPAALALDDPRANTMLRVRVAYGVCREICIPDEAVLTLAVPPAGWHAPGAAERIRAALARVPDRGGEAAWRLTQVALRDGKLTVEAESTEALTAPDLFVEGPREARFGTTVAMLGADRHKVRFEIPVEGLAAGTSQLVLTFVDGSRAFERRATVPFP